MLQFLQALLAVIQCYVLIVGGIIQYLYIYRMLVGVLLIVTTDGEAGGRNYVCARCMPHGQIGTLCRAGLAYAITGTLRNAQMRVNMESQKWKVRCASNASELALVCKNAVQIYDRESLIILRNVHPMYHIYEHEHELLLGSRIPGRKQHRKKQQHVLRRTYGLVGSPQ